MAVLVGIDEAGLGPVLGPLVMTAVALEVSDQLFAASLWDALEPVVSRRPERDRRRLAIADSKKLYASGSRERGLELLERGVLATLATAAPVPASLGELLSIAAPGVRAALAEYPWYRTVEAPVPAIVPADVIHELGERLGGAMADAGARLLSLSSEVLLAGEFNRLMARTGNKGDVHWALAARLLTAIRACAPDQHMIVHVDRHGGRKRYAERLQAVFPAAFVWVLEETATSSSYVVEGDGWRMEVSFTVRCEDRQLPVALASMASKYLREHFMGMLNSFWRTRLPALVPTAGYPVDGRRFFAEVSGSLADLGVGELLMLRQGPPAAPR